MSTEPSTLFRKKPVVIEAFQLPAAGVDVPDAFHQWCERVGFEKFTSGRDETLDIETLEGTMTAQAGDWIIRGIKGEFYPCKPDIFAATYEPTSPTPALPAERGETADLAAIYDAFSIGANARSIHILMMNLSNVLRRERCLAAIERTFFMVPTEPEEEDDGVWGEECLLNWGQDPSEYVRTFREALKTINSVEAESVYLVATGETHEGQETYTRHDVRPPLCEAETLYTRAALRPQSAPTEAGGVASGSQIITLCGSARFERLFKAWNEALTMAGHTIFSLTAYPSDKAGVKQWYTEEQKQALDAAHFRKIEASDAIFVLNRHAYLGESTLREVEYARQLGKTVYFLESWGKGHGISGSHTDEAQRAVEADGLSLPTASPIDTTTRSGSKDPWASQLLGPAGALRSAIVELTKNAALSTLPAPSPAAGVGVAAPNDAFVAAYMAACAGRAPDHNEIGLHYFRAGAALSATPVAALRIHHEWSIKHMPGYSADGDERVAYRATLAALAASPSCERQDVGGGK